MRSFLKVLFGIAAVAAVVPAAWVAVVVPQRLGCWIAARLGWAAYDAGRIGPGYWFVGMLPFVLIGGGILIGAECDWPERLLQRIEKALPRSRRKAVPLEELTKRAETGTPERARRWLVP